MAKDRDPLDRYYTPCWAVDQCIDIVIPTVHFGTPGFILEPSAGRGVFVDALRTRYTSSHIYAIDVDPDVGPWSGADQNFEGDFLETDWSQVFGEFRLDLVVGNPPYARAVEFCQAALEICDTVIYILRTDFLNSASRSRFFREHEPSYVFLLPNRPSFYGPAMLPPYTDKPKEGQTGEYDYAWICWSPKSDDIRTQLIWLPEVPSDIRRGHVRSRKHASVC